MHITSRDNNDLKKELDVVERTEGCGVNNRPMLVLLNRAFAKMIAWR